MFTFDSRFLKYLERLIGFDCYIEIMLSIGRFECPDNMLIEFRAYNIDKPRETHQVWFSGEELREMTRSDVLERLEIEAIKFRNKLLSIARREDTDEDEGI